MVASTEPSVAKRKTKSRAVKGGLKPSNDTDADANVKILEEESKKEMTIDELRFQIKESFVCDLTDVAVAPTWQRYSIFYLLYCVYVTYTLQNLENNYSWWTKGEVFLWMPV